MKSPINSLLEHQHQIPKKSPELAELLRDTEYRIDNGLLSEHEEFWRVHYSFLKSRGYLLRYRYSPDRIPVRPSDPKFVPNEEVDEQPSICGVYDVDATHISDSSCVLIKKCAPEEADMYRKYASEPLASHPKNHCIPLIEAIPVPGEAKLDLVVMPFCNGLNLLEVQFQTVGEAVDFFSQICEGLQFMHENQNYLGCRLTHLTNVYRYIDRAHVLKKAIPKPELRNRTQHPVRYYLAGFELSGTQHPSDAPRHTMGEDPKMFLPEFRSKGAPYNRFAVDVFLWARMMSEMLDGRKRVRGFDFMRGLLAEMMNDDPDKRPKMDEVVRRLDGIKWGLSWWKSRARFARADEYHQWQHPECIMGAFGWDPYCNTGVPRPAGQDVPVMHYGS
ncbi:hypothetical protein FB45DRAFT_756998 [Roridomyces roridus]|uniref:Protein kinase domain-containing protein n=1 Tax=Roridomyces roridus TaxID=1738132 RepID=A0AAD7FCW9_9AGAR|nr:hypothetical protein FB45DRAFT_756998 [Roridomyces roridus]